MHINISLQQLLPEDLRLVNLLGAFAVALSDAIRRTSAERTMLPEPLPAALIQIGSFSGDSSERLSKNIALSQSATARVIQRLKENGLLNIEASTQDRRAIKLKLTELGERQRSEALAARAEVISGITSLLSSGEKELLTKVIERVFPIVVPDRSTSDFTCRYCDIKSCPQECCPAEPESDTWKFSRQVIFREESVDYEKHT